ncbi:MAG: SPFH domain-containing protein [Minisyncoccota bacterium]
MFRIGMGNIIFVLIVLGIIALLQSVFLSLAIIGLAMTLYGYGLTTIPSNPPSVGLVTISGTRIKHVLPEGLHILAPYFPLFIDVIVMEMVSVNQDCSDIKFWCKLDETENTQKSNTKTSFRGGLPVSLTSSVTWRPDPTRLDAFMDNGNRGGVESILDDMFRQVLRIEGAKLTFEALVSSNETLVEIVFSRLVKEDFHMLSEEDKHIFKKEMKANGKQDIEGLGITIFKVNIGEPALSPDDQETVQEQVKEQYQRRAGLYEVDTEIAQARQLYQAYQETDEPQTLHDCILEIRRRKSMREGRGNVYEIPGIEAIGATLGSILSGNKVVAQDPDNDPPPQTPQSMRRRAKKPREE